MNFSTDNPSEELRAEDSLIRIRSVAEMAKQFRLARKENKITMVSLAKFAELSRVAISEFENSKRNIRLGNLMKLLELCGIELYIKVRK